MGTGEYLGVRKANAFLSLKPEGFLSSRTTMVMVGFFSVSALTSATVFQMAGFEIQVIHTPGHTAGGACYYIADEEVLFAGDTLFCGSVGRTDLPTGSMAQLHASLHEKLFALPSSVAVYPGHDEATTIGYEQRYNPY